MVQQQGQQVTVSVFDLAVTGGHRGQGLFDVSEDDGAAFAALERVEQAKNLGDYRGGGHNDFFGIRQHGLPLFYIYTSMCFAYRRCLTPADIGSIFLKALYQSEEGSDVMPPSRQSFLFDCLTLPNCKPRFSPIDLTRR